ncbi:tetratricopeptide repeat protein [Planctomyces sp. SH-PL62]|uniref:tetratricopeptide repeat protein n=1 Tax=Planctomyces sp. SH-PL62 TaxID=1636152 RepID=UPI00078EF32E|nr:tetratricopeptide repeat protein [Planctomyces sp. SH-PL62]AMV40636.1 hypothetical protein VT85_24610 [Planctomyces sp. SH-PL62]
MNQESVGGEGTGEGAGGESKLGEALVRLVEKARACWERMAWEESEGPLGEALQLAEAEAGPNSPPVAWALEYTAWLAMRTERYADAVADYRRALAIHEATAGPDHPASISTRIELAGALFVLGGATDDGAVKESAYREADEQAVRAIGAFDASGREDLALAECLAETGWRRYWIGRLADAEPLLTRALSLLERLAGAADERTTRTALRLGMTYENGGFEIDAAPCYRKALAGLEERLHDAHPNVLDARARLARRLRDTGREDESAAHFDRIVAVLLDDASGIDWGIGRWYLDDCGQYLRDAGRLDELEDLEVRAAGYNVMEEANREQLEEVEARHGHDSVEYAGALMNLAAALGYAGKREEAVEAVERVSAILRARLGPDDPAVVEAEERLEMLRKSAELPADRPRRRRRLGREETKPFGGFSAPWADERRADLIRSYLDTLDRSAGDEEDDDPSGAQMAVTMLSFMADADEQWGFLLELIAAAPDDAQVLQAIAAGPLEGFLGRFDGEVVDRVVTEAARDPKFRRVLSGVWKHGMSDPVWDRIRAVQKTVPDPLPEMRPFDDAE